MSIELKKPFNDPDRQYWVKKECTDRGLAHQNVSLLNRRIGGVPASGTQPDEVRQAGRWGSAHRAVHFILPTETIQNAPFLRPGQGQLELLRLQLRCQRSRA